jgi:hypothetical protein
MALGGDGWVEVGAVGSRPAHQTLDGDHPRTYAGREPVLTTVLDGQPLSVITLTLLVGLVFVVRLTQVLTRTFLPTLEAATPRQQADPTREPALEGDGSTGDHPTTVAVSAGWDG